MFFFMNTDFWRAMPPPPSLHHNDNKNNNKKNILIIALFKTRMVFCEKKQRYQKLHENRLFKFGLE